jgi:hypothetical protein
MPMKIGFESESMTQPETTIGQEAPRASGTSEEKTEAKRPLTDTAPWGVTRGSMPGLYVPVRSAGEDV